MGHEETSWVATPAISTLPLEDALCNGNSIGTCSMQVYPQSPITLATPPLQMQVGDVLKEVNGELLDDKTPFTQHLW